MSTTNTTNTINIKQVKSVYLSTPLGEVKNNFVLGDKVLTSIHEAYKKKNLSRIRDDIKAKHLVYDSGGFQYLMQNEPLPSVEKAVSTMQKLGMTSKDIAIQLDLPTNPLNSREKRIATIEKSTALYKEQKELHKCHPVVHGWEEEEIIKHMDLLELDQKVATGAWIAASTRGVAIASGTAEEKTFHLPVDKVYKRLGLLLKLLNDYDLFVLGAGSVNMCHLVWAHGATLTDGSSWRFQAKFWQVMIPENTCIGFGSKRQTGRKITSNDIAILTDIKELDGYPLQSLSLDDLFLLFKAGGSEGFKARASHNAYVMLMEEQIANNFINDPDKYHKYLLSRWRNSSYWLKRFSLVTNEVNRTYVQNTLDLYLKNGFF